MTALNTILGLEELDVPLLSFSKDDHFTCKDSMEGLMIFGTSGSGKTSSVGAQVALQMLRNGYGGLVLLAKPEIELWKTYCKIAGRLDDLRVIEPGGPYRFNFIDYEARQQQGDGAGLAANIADIILKLSDVAGNSGQQNDSFWEGERLKSLINPIEAVILAGNELTPKSIYDVVISAPSSDEELDSKKWRDSSHCYQTLLKIRQRIERNELTEEEIDDYHVLEDYFLLEHLRLHEKTRGIVRAMFTSFFTEFNRRPNRKLFCSDTTITPEACLTGKIIIVNLPARNYNKVGIVAQKLMKLMFQRTVERSMDHIKHRAKMFLFADEFQTFFYPYDVDYQATARSSGVATVYLTQNLPNVYNAAGGGPDAENRIKALVANLNTQVFLANSDLCTNTYAADLIGKHTNWTKSKNRSMGGDVSFSKGEQESLDYVLRPEAFHKLRTGGRKNNYLVDGYIVKTGTVFKINQSPVLLVTFPQKL